MKKASVSLLAITAGLLALLAYKSWDNYTIWEWLATAGIASLILIRCFAMLQTRRRHPHRSVPDALLDTAAYAALAAAILALPNLGLATGCIAVHYCFAGMRYVRLLRQCRGPRKKFPADLANSTLPLFPLFGALALTSLLYPSTPEWVLGSALLLGLLAWPLAYTHLRRTFHAP